MLDAPLLFECGMEKYTDEVWLVDADIEVRLHRIYLRDGLSKEAIWDRIKNQMSAEEKAEKADFVIIYDEKAAKRLKKRRFWGKLKEDLKCKNVTMLP